MNPNTLKMLLLWIAVPLALLGILFVVNAGVLAVCIYALLLLFLGSGLMTRLWLRPMRVERNLSAEIINLGEAFHVHTRILNPTPWPILWVYVEETLPRGERAQGTTRRLMFLAPRQAINLTYRISPSRRGCFALGPVVLESGDIFGLFRRCWVAPGRSFVTVLPNYPVIGEFQVGQRRALGDMNAVRSIFDDPTRIQGIREYRRGDAFNRIHWKTSARTGQLFTKIYEPVLEIGATVVLDFHRQSWEDAVPPPEPPSPPERAVEIAASIARYLNDGGWEVGFFTNGRDPLGLAGISYHQARETGSLSEARLRAHERVPDDRLAPIHIPPRRHSEQFRLIHETLGRVELSDGLRIQDALLSELAHLDRQQVLAVLTGDASEAFIEKMLRVRAQGYRMMIFFICNPVAHDRAYTPLVAGGIEVFEMTEEWRLREIAIGRQYL